MSAEPEVAYVPDVSGIVTEDDTPVDSWFCEKERRLLTEPLYASWAGPGEGRPFIAASDVGIFSGISTPPLVPDAFLSLGVRLPADYWAKRHRSYFLWEFGKAPEVVIEIVSKREGEETGKRLLGYEKLRIPLYVVFDPELLLSERPLRLFEMRWVRYRELRVESVIKHELLDNLGLGLALWRGEVEGFEAEWLRWTDATGSILETGGEKAQRATRRADEQARRADEQARLAIQESERAERLAQRLRALGVDPAE